MLDPMFKTACSQSDNPTRLKESVVLKRRFSLLTLLVGLVAVTALTSCKGDFIENAARGSLSSFIIDIMSTAISETIDPADN